MTGGGSDVETSSSRVVGHLGFGFGLNVFTEVLGVPVNCPTDDLCIVIWISDPSDREI